MKHYIVICTWTHPESGKRRSLPFTVMAENETEAKYMAEQMLPDNAHNATDLRSEVRVSVKK